MKLQQSRLGKFLDVGGEQYAMLPGTDAQHTAAFVVVLGCLHCMRGGRVEHLEAHAVPLPRLSIRTCLVMGGELKLGMAIRQRRDDIGDRDAKQYGFGSAYVVDIVMRQHERIQLRDPHAAQGGEQDTAAAVRFAGEIGPGVVEQRMGMRLHRNGQTLSHVEHDQPGAACRWLLRRDQNIGSNSKAPSGRMGKPRGASIHSAPPMPATTVRAGGACCAHTT